MFNEFFFPFYYISLWFLYSFYNNFVMCLLAIKKFSAKLTTCYYSCIIANLLVFLTIPHKKTGTYL